MMYGESWEQMLREGGNTLIRMNTTRRLEEIAADFLVSSLLAHQLGEQACAIFVSEGYRARFPPSMPEPQWRGKSYVMRNSARQARERGELEPTVELALDRFQSALDTLGLEASVDSVMKQLDTALEQK